MDVVWVLLVVCLDGIQYPLPGVQSPVGIRPLQQHGHFITADAGDHILVTETIFDQLGYVLQSQIAGLVAVLVVDFLEVVHIHDQDADRK